MTRPGPPRDPARVSILTRTLGRPCLAEAAESVAAQSYRPLEWIVVDAAGRGIDAPRAGDIPVRVVSLGEPLRRSRAANVALDHATGARALILDDDDLLEPGAVEVLARGLDDEPGTRLAYGNVRIDTGDAARSGTYRFEYSELLVTRRNLFPPHAALFDLSLCREDGVRFDESLDWFEDWAFWLDASAHTRFLHVREVTAVYRLWLSQSGVWQVGEEGADPRMAEQRDRVIQRGAARRSRLEARHAELKQHAASLAAAGRHAEAAAAWMAAHQSDHYDVEPILRYADLAARAGDARAVRGIVESGLALLPNEPALYRMKAAFLERLGDRTEAARALDSARRLEASGPHSPI
ncbi:MAG: glycosyltransferase [Betaproteobacteria bacterium]